MFSIINELLDIYPKPLKENTVDKGDTSNKNDKENPSQ
jgi:hypothetical protein